MLNVVFTGPAHKADGTPILRADLTATAAKKNIKVQSSVKADTHILVASRADTVKARTAAKRGLAVFTYPEFIAKFLGDVEIEPVGQKDKFVDAAPQAPKMPFVKGAALAELDVL